MVHFVRHGPALVFDILTSTCWWRSFSGIVTIMLLYVLIRLIRSTKQADGFEGMAEA